MTFLRPWNIPGGGGGGPLLVFPGDLAVWTEQTPAEDAPVWEHSHDVVGLRTQDGKMQISNVSVPLKKLESPYGGGGMSSLPGAAGDPSPVMVPDAPAMLAGGLQLSPRQVAVVRVDETHAGESSGREYPCTTQSRHRPIDLYELPDDLPHTVVGGGPVAALLAQKLLNHSRCWFMIMLTPLVSIRLHRILVWKRAPLAQLLWNCWFSIVLTLLVGILIWKWAPLAQQLRNHWSCWFWIMLTPLTGSRRHVRFRILPWTVDLWRGFLTWSIRLRGGGGSLNSGPMEGIVYLEPLEQSILHSRWIAQRQECVIEKGSVWKPVLNPVISYTLDSQLMEGNIMLWGCPWTVEGASFLEPWKQPVPGSSLAVRPVEGVTQKGSEWKLVLNPAISYTLDSRPMEGTTYQERSAPGVSLDSRPMEGASCLEPLEQFFTRR